MLALLVLASTSMKLTEVEPVASILHGHNISLNFGNRLLKNPGNLVTLSGGATKHALSIKGLRACKSINGFLRNSPFLSRFSFSLFNSRFTNYLATPIRYGSAGCDFAPYRFENEKYQARQTSGNLGITQCTAVFKGCEFTNCKTADNEDGGALCLSTVVMTEMTQCKFTNCVSAVLKASSGGALCATGSGCVLKMETCKFYQCEANQWGGAMYLTDIELTGSNIRCYTCKTISAEGGAMFCVGCKVNITAVTWEACSASKSQGAGGAGMYMKQGILVSGIDMNATNCEARLSALCLHESQLGLIRYSRFINSVFAAAANTLYFDKCEFKHTQGSDTGSVQYTLFDGTNVPDKSTVWNDVAVKGSGSIALKNLCFVGVIGKLVPFGLLSSSSATTLTVTISDCTTNTATTIETLNNVKISGSVDIMTNQAYKGCCERTASHIFTMTDIFTETAEFTGTGEFTVTAEFTATHGITDSGVFTDSAALPRSGEFSESKQFTDTQSFPTPTDVFTDSQFLPTHTFHYSDAFTHSQDFDSTQEFSESMSFTTPWPTIPPRTPYPTQTEKPEAVKTDIGLIAGVAVGGIIVIVLIVILVVCITTKCRRSAEISISSEDKEELEFPNM